MNRILKILLAIVFIPLISSGSFDISYWNADLVRAYVHNSEMQRRWAFSFIASHLKSLQGDERILDIGCGDGKITADISKFVPNGSVLGIDLSEPMIEWAQKQYHPTEYPNVSFQLGGFIEPNVQEQFDLIVSFCALLHSGDPQKGIYAIASLLKPKGKLLILVPTRNNPAWNTARITVQSRARWAPYWQNTPPRKSFTTQQYTEFLQNANLTNIEVKSVKTMDPFIDKNEIIEWLCGTFAPAIPLEYMHEFYNEWIKEYIRLDPNAQRYDNVIYAALGYITMVAQKS